jgi:hypothetical protein
VAEPRRHVPVVCDLADAPDTAEERIAEYQRLFARHLVECTTADGMVRFRFRADDRVEAWVRDLMAREQRCCGFFEFTVRLDDDDVIWDATVGDDDAARAMLAEWARLPEAVAGGTDEVRDRWTGRGLEFVVSVRPAPA